MSRFSTANRGLGSHVLHNLGVEDLSSRIEDLANLMEEFALTEAQLSGPDWKVAFRRPKRLAAPERGEDTGELPDEPAQIATPAPAVSVGPQGTPINSPMNGIYYSAPSPSAPPFVHVGEAVVAGQVVGLIEAMKVFNEIVSPVSGTVEKLVAETGQLVQPGDPLLYVV